MKKRMDFRVWFVMICSIVIAACGESKKDQDSFEVRGSISNNPSAKKIYLEEIPVTMDRKIVDSAEIEKDGDFRLKTGKKESTVYNLRIDNNEYPLTSLINDTSPIIVDAKFNSSNKQFAENYEVKGSIASQQMKDYITSLNNDLQKIFLLSRKADSLSQSGNAPDSMFNSAIIERSAIARHINQSFYSALSQSSNAALSMFILSYYQSTANNPGFRIQPLATEEVSRIVNGIAAKNPAHTGVASIKRSIDSQLRKAHGLVGQQAPDFALPDVNGNVIKLSSFRGKYVLVDFWASWCKPCRIENPNLVKAYQQFGNRNFTILGVSLERPGEKDEWVKAIMQDNLTWPQVSDLKYWESEIVPLYGIDGIPFNVLIDPDGKVVAQGLTGTALESKLAEVLK